MANKLMSSIFVLSGRAIDNFHYLLIISIFLFVLLIAMKTPNIQASLLLSLALPGAIVWPLTILIRSPSDLTAYLLLLVVFPACWILPIITLCQIPQLRVSKRRLGPMAYVGSITIAVLYAATSFVSRNL